MQYDDLDLIYENMVNNAGLPPGISKNDILTVDEYAKTVCGADEDEDEDEDEEAVTEAEAVENDPYNPRVGTNIRDVGSQETGEILQKRSQKQKLKPHIPYLHPSNIVDENKNPVDEEELKRKIMIRPNFLLSKNSKMSKSEGEDLDIFNINLPAFSGFFVDEASPNKDLKILRVCPSAGQCVTGCYALGGSYVQWKDVQLSQTQRLNYLMNDWQNFKNELKGDITLKDIQAKRNGRKLAIRWHDSGDFFSDGYMQIAFDIARETPSVIHYAYTKEYEKFSDSNKPKNFEFNISYGGQKDSMIQPEDKSANVIPTELFKDLLSKKKGEKWKISDDGMRTLKDRISDKYNISRETVLTYDELLEIPYDYDKQYAPTWSVIVVPTVDGDRGAFRRDVLRSLLLYH
jgi:hypothetical protein